MNPTKGVYRVKDEEEVQIEQKQKNQRTFQHQKNKYTNIVWIKMDS